MFKNGFPKRPWTDAEKWILGIVAALIVTFCSQIISGSGTKKDEQEVVEELPIDCDKDWREQSNPEKCY